MSDPSAEPGAPTGGATNVSSASEKSIASEVKQRVPSNLISIARAPDNILLRLNKYARCDSSRHLIIGVLTCMADFLLAQAA